MFVLSNDGVEQKSEYSTSTILLFSMYSSISTQKSVVEYYLCSSTFTSTPLLKAIFAIKGLILSAIQENICQQGVCIKLKCVNTVVNESSCWKKKYHAAQSM